MGNTYFKADDAQSARQAEFFCTIGDRRYSMLNAKNFEASSALKYVFPIYFTPSLTNNSFHVQFGHGVDNSDCRINRN